MHCKNATSQFYKIYINIFSKALITIFIINNPSIIFPSLLLFFPSFSIAFQYFFSSEWVERRQHFWELRHHLLMLLVDEHGHAPVGLEHFNPTLHAQHQSQQLHAICKFFRARLIPMALLQESNQNATIFRRLIVELFASESRQSAGICEQIRGNFRHINKIKKRIAWDTVAETIF